MREVQIALDRTLICRGLSTPPPAAVTQFISTLPCLFPRHPFNAFSLSRLLLQGMGYLHAKGILHKDLKSKNVFYDNGKVVITDFGLFSISGVLQAGR